MELKRVVVTGLGALTPIGNNIQEYWDALVSGKRANAKGLLNRPTIETAKDTLAWWKTLPTERTKKLRAGLSLELEKDLLNRFKS